MKSYTISTECFSPKIRNKLWTPPLPMLFWHGTGSLSQCSRKGKEKTRQTDWIRRNKTVSIHRLHDCLHKKCQGTYKNILRTNMTVQQGYRIPDKPTKYNFISIPWTHRYQNFKKYHLQLTPKVKYLCVNLTRYI